MTVESDDWHGGRRFFQCIAPTVASDHPVLKTSIFFCWNANVIAASFDINPTLSPTILACTRRIIQSHLDFSAKIRTCQNWSGPNGSDSPTGGSSVDPTVRRIIRWYWKICFLLAFVQLITAVIWTLQIYSISAFSLRLECLDGGLDVSTVNWTSWIWFGLHPRDLRNPTNLILQTR